MQNQQDILISQTAGVLQIGMNRPLKKNALTHAMYTTMADALKDSVADDSVKVVLIHGTEDTFTAGNDLKVPRKIST